VAGRVEQYWQLRDWVETQSPLSFGLTRLKRVCRDAPREAAMAVFAKSWRSGE
jgi:hypothetical protein